MGCAVTGRGGDKRRKPERVSDVIAGYLQQKGLAARVDQAAVIPEWPSLVGAQVAAVTEPRSVTPDGTLFVWVTTNAWMMELSLLEPELLRALNAKPDRTPVRRIRWQLRQPNA
jgi:predicted nucleic acid-binding Zn ribbon protein